MAEVIQFKGIRPKRMNLAAMRDEILMALRDEGDDTKAEFGKTTATWSHVVPFEIIVDITGGTASVLVGTDDKIFGYVDKGTRPHVIRPRRARTLRFRSGYRAKTRPGHVGSFAGGAYGDTVHARVVHHPGTKARHLSETIQKQRKPKFTRRMVQAMKRGAEKMY